MWTATKSTKCCATCSNWAGERKVNNTSFVETPHHDTKGKCYEGVFSSATLHLACEGKNCSKYRKLGILK